jgi:hypothetical protein
MIRTRFRKCRSCFGANLPAFSFRGRAT